MRKLVVSMHDVSPMTRDVFTSMLAELGTLGVTKTSLLVIANHHRRGHMLADAGFCRWLESLAGQGHELVIHGYYHQRAPRSGETARQRWITGTYTQGEGEFYDLSAGEAAALLARAQDDFRRLDAPQPTGFIAPAWLLGRGALAAVRQAGFRYTTYLTGLQHLAADETDGNGFEHSQSLVYSCRNLWRRVCSLGWNALLRARLQHQPLLRLGLHPPDYQHPRVWEQIRRFAREETDRREVSTYAEYVDAATRASSPVPSSA